MASSSRGGVSVFQYTDFRKYLADHYAAEKIRRPSFSYRTFARRAGFSSPNFLKLVIDGQRNVGKGSVPAFTKALGLDGDEATFFADLVAFGQGRTIEEKNRHFERIAASRRFRAARRIDGPFFDYLSHWWMPAIRELAGRADFRDDPTWIAGELRPRIKPAEAKRALATLETLGLLVRDARGRLARGEPTLTTGHEVRSVAVVNFHRQMLERAAAAIEEQPSTRREFAAVTVCIRAETVSDLKVRVQRFCEEILERSDRDSEPELVYQMNVQLFALAGGDVPR
jgi:uncharacterized protein (TIGR02147 family)